MVINISGVIVITILFAIAVASDQLSLPSLYFRGNHYQLGFETVSSTLFDIINIYWSCCNVVSRAYLLAPMKPFYTHIYWIKMNSINNYTRTNY